jgi:hypothetical protein
VKRSYLRGNVFGCIIVLLFLGKWHPVLFSGSNLAENQKYDNNQKDQSNSSARIISPTPAMRPPWQGAHQRQDKNNDQYGSKHFHSSLACSQDA